MTGILISWGPINPKPDLGWWVYPQKNMEMSWEFRLDPIAHTSRPTLPKTSPDMTSGEANVNPHLLQLPGVLVDHFWMEIISKKRLGTLPETNIAMENPPFWWYLPGKMGIFMGYVSFREGSMKHSQTIQQMSYNLEIGIPPFQKCWNSLRMMREAFTY